MKEHFEILSDGQTARLLIINDTGCGTSARSKTSKSGEWNIKSFIDYHLNPTGSTPYLILLSHCHYDHILGLDPILRSAHSTTLIASSAYSRSFLEPHSKLRNHSLCTSLNLACPTYKTTLWAQHNTCLTVSLPRYKSPMHLPVITLHTPGHTPDSLSWFDEDERALYVGDAFYEAPAPILFPSEGVLADWWRSVDVLIAFVAERNGEGSMQRVTLSAGHVTAGVDAMACLIDVKGFMKRVLRGEVVCEEQRMKRGERFGMWSEEGGRFSLGAPLRVVRDGRLDILEEEWKGM